ncbi:MAG: AbrB/MazE/SpoVT family DNA-binding domain-containing protein, partial [Terriglobales bacterium]
MAHRIRVRRPAPAEVPAENYGVVMGNRGRLVLPAALRRRLKVGEGDRLVLTVQPDGTVRMVSVR